MYLYSNRELIQGRLELTGEHNVQCGIFPNNFACVWLSYVGVVSSVTKAILDRHFISKQTIQSKTTGTTLVTLITVNGNSVMLNK